ncbi:MAG TPA: aminoglycoside 3'-phosphotransferase [Acidimicrobiales bacterium]|nr:aminoglycoside 3'-phosphotransferase [Acidimicrobiales bacterium]
MRRVDPPPGVREFYRAWTWSVAWSYEGVVTTWRLSWAGQVRFLKVRAVEDTPRLLAEAARLRWARDHLPVPSVVACGTEQDVDWLVVDALPGRDATDPGLKARPERLVPLLARGLRRFHEAPVEACPFRLTVTDALVTVRQRVADGQACHADLHTEFRHLSLDDAVAMLDELAPEEKSLVVCHGDYCFPNVLIEGDAVTGYLDLGELAVADPWWDVAVASWSTTWNVGPGWENVFLDAYGVEPDPPRTTFYRLLYDLIS